MNPSPDKEKLWVAYLDGQLSASEALAFEATLSPAERAMCALELRFERSLGDHLRETLACPDTTWRKAAEMVQHKSGGRKTSWLSRPYVAIPTFIGFAAALILTFQTMPTSAKSRDPLFSVAETIEELQQSAATDADDDSVQNFLQQRDVRLVFAGAPAADHLDHHQIRLLGACERGCRGTAVVEVLFECCGQPAKVLIAERGSRAESILRHGCDSVEIQHVRDLNGYVAAVLSRHEAADLTQLFNTPEHRVADNRVW